MDWKSRVVSRAAMNPYGSYLLLLSGVWMLSLPQWVAAQEAIPNDKCNRDILEPIS